MTAKQYPLVGVDGIFTVEKPTADKVTIRFEGTFQLSERTCTTCGREFSPLDKAVMCEGCGADCPGELVFTVALSSGLQTRDGAVYRVVLPIFTRPV